MFKRFPHILKCSKENSQSIDQTKKLKNTNQLKLHFPKMTTKKAFKHKYCASCAVYRSKIKLLQFIGIPKGLNKPF